MALYFRVWLLIPFLSVLIVQIHEWLPVFEPVAPVWMAAYAVRFAGIPYIGFVCCALLWSVVKKDANHKKAFIYSPFFFGICCVLYFNVALKLLITYHNPDIQGLGVPLEFSIFAVFVLGIYALIALVFWYFFKAFRKSGSTTT